MTKVRNPKYLKTLGGRIKKIRTDKSISTYQLSYDSDISRNQINSIEKGEINPTICTLKALADALKIEVKEMIDF